MQDHVLGVEPEIFLSALRIIESVDGGPQRFTSKNFGERATFAVKATRPGIIHYLCTIHPTSMNGTIEVVK